MGELLSERSLIVCSSLLIFSAVLQSPLLVTADDYSPQLDLLDSDRVASASETGIDKRVFYPFSSLYAGRRIRVDDDHFDDELRSRGHVSTRSRSFIGKRGDYERARSSSFIGKRGQLNTRSRSFIGKRPFDDDDGNFEQMEDKRDYPNVFYRMLDKEYINGQNGLAASVADKKNSEDTFNEYKRRSFIGKRSADSMKSQEPVQEKAHSAYISNIGFNINEVRPVQDENQPSFEFISNHGSSKRRSFIGKRTRESLPDVFQKALISAEKRRSFIGKRVPEEFEKRRSFIGKRTGQSTDISPTLNDDFLWDGIVLNPDEHLIPSAMKEDSSNSATESPSYEGGARHSQSTSDSNVEKRRSFIGKKSSKGAQSEHAEE